MAKLGSNSVHSAEQVENPIKIFLENIKGELGVWNKEKKENEFHSLDNFLVLNTGYTIKGQVWDDSIKKYTATYFSNEVHSFNETFFAIEMTFDANKKAHKRLKAKGFWNNHEEPKASVKSKMPSGIGLKVGITVLDLNDNIVKEFFVGISDYINNIQSELKDATPETKWGYDIKSMYTNGTKVEGKEVFITESEVNKLPGLKAAEYKKRYISSVENKGAGSEEEITNAENVLDKVILHLDTKKEYYKKTYGDGDTGTTGEQKQYAGKPVGVQSDEDFKKEVEAEQKGEPVVKAKGETEKHNSSGDISISDIPF